MWATFDRVAARLRMTPASDPFAPYPPDSGKWYTHPHNDASMARNPGARPRGFKIARNPRITPKELHSFYVRTGACEAGFPVATAGRVLTRSDVILGAYQGERLVGIARGLCDGTSGHVAELCVDPALQGSPLRFSNASVIERDEAGLGHILGERLLHELRRLGAQFVSGYVISGVEERFYRGLGFGENRGHKVFIIDAREYVAPSRRIGRFPGRTRRRSNK